MAWTAWRWSIKLIPHLDQECFQHVLRLVRQMSYWLDHIPDESVKIVCLRRTNPGFFIAHWSPGARELGVWIEGKTGAYQAIA